MLVRNSYSEFKECEYLIAQSFNVDENSLGANESHVKALCETKSRKEDMDMRQEGGKLGNERGKGIQGE